MTQQQEVSSVNTDNSNKINDINNLHSKIEQWYHNIINAATFGFESNNTIKQSIQQVALSYEEIYKLHGQDWMINQIGSIIVKDLKTRGFPETKYKYVYYALKEYDNKFYTPVEHSYSQSVEPSTKLQELFYRTNGKRYYEAFETLKEMRNDYDNLLTRDIQTIVPNFLSEFDYHEKQCKQKGILIEKDKQDDFEGGPDPFGEKIPIHKPVPKLPESMAEEINTWITSFLPALLKKLTEYPLDETKDKRMAAGWCAIRHMHDPSTDDKYREHWPGWIEIVHFADQTFKHHAASHFKTQDYRGQWRKLTREQIGARKTTIPQWCKWFFDNIPGFMEEISWFRESKKPYTSGFSIDLSPKLSNASMR